MNAYIWPDSPAATRAEVLDRARLVIDLDEATDPEAFPSALLLVGVPRSGHGVPPDLVTTSLIEGLGTWVGELVGDRGSVYRTRSTEVCALIDGDAHELGDVRAALQRKLAHEDCARSGVTVAFVALPAETTDAVGALELVDRRMTARGTGGLPGSAAKAGSSPVCRMA